MKKNQAKINQPSNATTQQVKINQLTTPVQDSGEAKNDLLNQLTDSSERAADVGSDNVLPSGTTMEEQIEKEAVIEEGDTAPKPRKGKRGRPKGSRKKSEAVTPGNDGDGGDAVPEDDEINGIAIICEGLVIPIVGMKMGKDVSDVKFTPAEHKLLNQYQPPSEFLDEPSWGMFATMILSMGTAKVMQSPPIVTDIPPADEATTNPLNSRHDNTNGQA